MKRTSKRPNSRKSLFFLCLGSFLMLLLLFSCESNSTDPANQQLELSSASSSGLSSSWYAVHSLSSADEVHQIVAGDLELDDEEFSTINSLPEVKNAYRNLADKMQQVFQQDRLNGVQEDSLLWFIDWTDSIRGISVRKALYYNTESGLARYYEAVYRFPAHLRLVYDSSEVKVDLNYTLEDSTDDKLLSLFKLTRFKSSFLVEEIEANAQATSWNAKNEVNGAHLTNTVRYSTQSHMEQLSQEMILNPDESGSMSERLDYRDGTFMQKSMNFYSDYSGEYSETWRDGTQVSGTFDRLEDDMHAELTRVIDFAGGYLLDRVEQSAEVSRFPENSFTELILNEKVFFTSGRVDTSQLEVEEFFENSLKKTHLVGQKSDGSRADLMVTHYDEFREIEGDFLGHDGYYSVIKATVYEDGSGEMWLTVYESESAYESGAQPVATIYIQFNPDGSGTGQLTEGEMNYNVEIDQKGEMTVHDQNGKSGTFLGY